MADAPARISRPRRLRDRFATLSINFAGAAVIGLIALILAYLIYVAMPLGSKAEVARIDTLALDPAERYVVAGSDAALYRLPLGGLQDPHSHRGVLSRGRLAVDLLGNELRLFEVDGSRLLSEVAEPLPVVELPVRIPVPGIRPSSLSIDVVDRGLLIAYYDQSAVIQIIKLTLAGDSISALRRWSLDVPELPAANLLPDLLGGRLLAIDGNRYLHAALDPEEPGPVRVWFRGSLPGVTPGLSIVGWGPARETLLLVDAQQRLHRLDSARSALPRLGEALDIGFMPRWLGSERDRRVSYLLGGDGELLVLVPGSGDRLLNTRVSELAAPGMVGLSDGGGYLYLLGEGSFQRVALRNAYPETGWRSLWLAQSYSAYDQPDHIWHPDGGSIGVLSKYGLTPLLYGTFKAALCGMLLAVPLALGAAVYTGYLMPTRQRNRVKPAIEMLEAVPTVVLGFIAGLWAAPLLEKHLFFVLMLPVLLVLVPLVLSVLHFLLQLASPRFVRRPPRVLLLAICYSLSIWLMFEFAAAAEYRLFAGPVSEWALESFGLRYDQRNALLVGLAMGIAITPAMFSIVEDAVFAVPRSLSDGSAALGATRWQSLSRIVLPAAAPAILSALLIGLARGLGETMIVLLATGNTPIMEASLLSGMRGLSASIAAELPEAGTASVHFRLLFLAALVLFALTFVLNTVAELFRQRLRYSYAKR
jgi:ABC-type uncharacterized transport system permease subunit